jgi:hypothetical protein
MLKLFLVSLFLSANIQAAKPVNLFKCFLYKVIDSSVLEESLSAHEYPLVEGVAVKDKSGKINFDIDFGSANYSTKEGDKVSWEISGEESPNSDAEKGLLKVYPSTGGQFLLRYKLTGEKNEAVLLHRTSSKAKKT